MNFPTPDFMRTRETAEPTEFLRMPQLTPREAWLLDQYLEQVHEVLWDAYAEDILDYEDHRVFPDLHASEDEEPATPPPRPEHPGTLPEATF